MRTARHALAGALIVTAALITLLACPGAWAQSVALTGILGKQALLVVDGGSPRSVAVGLKAQVAISGTATAWSDSAQVMFGADVVVQRVRAANPTALVVDIQVSPNAAPGTRDVTVSNGSGSPLHYRNVFQIVPLVTSAVSGRAARGSMMNVTVTHNGGNGGSAGVNLPIEDVQKYLLPDERGQLTNLLRVMMERKEAAQQQQQPAALPSPDQPETNNDGTE